MASSQRSSILFLDHASALGGAERSLLLVLKHLSTDFWELHLVCNEGYLVQAASDRRVSVDIVRLERLRRSTNFPLRWFAGVRTIVRVATEAEADIIVANTVRAAAYGSIAACWARLPFVWHMRDFWLSESRPRHVWLDALGKRLLCVSAVRVIANSNATARHLPCPHKIVVVQNGIELEGFDPGQSGAPFRQMHDIPSDAPLVGMVGRLRPWKGQDRFLRAMAQVAEAVPTARFVVVGGTPFGVDDEYPARLLRLASELGLGQRTVFTGHLDDVRPALAAMDVFVHPGDPEPFGLVNVEAMAMAKPVVAFDHGALPEIVVDGETGMLVPPQNIAALAQAVIHLLEEPARGWALGRAGRTRARTQFTAARMAEEVEAVLRSALR